MKSKLLYFSSPFLRLFMLLGYFFVVTAQATAVDDSTSNRTIPNPVIIDRDARHHPILAAQGMVASQEALASEVGARILRRGGNAVDAAVATGFALAVTFPQAGNLGGGGFMLIHQADTGKTTAIDYREMAPRLANAKTFVDQQGNVLQQQLRFSGAATGIPGTVAGLLYALEKYGSMPLRTLLQPAINLASDGIVVSDSQAFSFQQAAHRLAQSPGAARYFLHPSGRPYQSGERWRQADLAATLERIANDGLAGFYAGKTAELITAQMQQSQGLITKKDLLQYRVVERQPVTGQYRGYTVASMPPPSSGGVHIVQMLNMLEAWDLASLGHNSAAYLHRLIEVMRRAYADRSRHLGDPDFHTVPLKTLTAKGYAQQMRQRISLNKARRSRHVAPSVIPAKESPETTHFVVWDKQGNVVSNTYTLNFSYGSGIAVSGAGFLLNNEMDDFAAKPGVPNAYGLVGGKANAVEPYKRPLSSMSPTLVLKDGKPIIATGSPGGSTIITVVLQQLLNMIDFNMNPAEAAAAPRIHHQWLPDKVFLEPGISQDTQNLLIKMGHHIAEKPRILGRVKTIAGTTTANTDGESYQQLQGAVDQRWPGGKVATE